MLALTMASSGTFLHTGLKLPYFMFFGTDRQIEAHEPPTNMLVAMAMAAVLCIAIGVFPGPLYALLPYPVAFEAYTGSHITESLGVLMFTALAFVLFLRVLDPENTVSLDTDWFYRRGARAFLWFAENRSPGTKRRRARSARPWYCRCCMARRAPGSASTLAVWTQP